MKKIKTLLAVLMVFTMVLSLTACAGTNSNGTANKQENEAQNMSEEDVTSAESEKAPVDNSTERIATVTGGDLYEILAADPYTEDDLIASFLEEYDLTVVDRFCAYNSSLNSRHLKSVLLTVVWNSDDWTFDALEAHYKTLVRYIIPWNRNGSRGFLMLTKEQKKTYHNNCYITIIIIKEGLVHAAKTKGHCGDDHWCRH